MIYISASDIHVHVGILGIADEACMVLAETHPVHWVTFDTYVGLRVVCSLGSCDSRFIHVHECRRIWNAEPSRRKNWRGSGEIIRQEGGRLRERYIR